MNTDIEQFAERLIQNEVLCCDSALVDELLKREIITIDEVENLSGDIEDLTWDVWIVGSNLPGYLPDSEPFVCDSAVSAMSSLAEMLERHRDEEEGEQHDEEYNAAIRDAESETGSELTVYAAGRAYWVTQENITTEQLRDSIGASSRWWDPFDDGYRCTDGFECMDDLQREPLEWWRVTRSLLMELRDIGEVVIDSEYGEWWGRCTSGQSLIQDGVFQRVAQRINSRIGG